MPPSNYCNYSYPTLDSKCLGMAHLLSCTLHDFSRSGYLSLWWCPGGEGCTRMTFLKQPVGTTHLFFQGQEGVSSVTLQELVNHCRRFPAVKLHRKAKSFRSSGDFFFRDAELLSWIFSRYNTGFATSPVILVMRLNWEEKKQLYTVFWGEARHRKLRWLLCREKIRLIKAPGV